MEDSERLTEFLPGRIWTRWIPLSFYGLPLGARMTAIRLKNGGMFIHSPTRLDKATQREIDDIGPVHFIVAPNRLHHLFLKDYFKSYPDARVYASPRLPEKRRDLGFHGVLRDEPELGWAEEIEQAVIWGSVYMDEVVFFDREAKTLIVADLLMWATRKDDFLFRLAASLAGTYDKPGLTREQKWMLRDRKAARTSIEKIMSWHFNRIILSHGRLVESGGKQVFHEAFSWLLGGKRDQSS